jgi:hypothetical protein
VLRRRKEGYLRELMPEGVSKSGMSKLGSFLTIVGDLLYLGSWAGSRFPIST